jgi:5-methylcytosine-specific restriction endonuclease McrA
MSRKPPRHCVGCGVAHYSAVCPTPPPSKRYPRLWTIAQERDFRGSNEWKSTRAVKRAQQPFCENCEREGRRHVLAGGVDHILPIATHPDARLVMLNLQSLCDSCHQRKALGLLPDHPIVAVLLARRCIRHEDSDRCDHCRER